VVVRFSILVKLQLLLLVCVQRHTTALGPETCGIL